MTQASKKCTVAESERILGVGSTAQSHNKLEERPLTKKTYTAAEVGIILGLTRASVYAAIRHGHIPSFKIGNNIFVPREAIDRKVAGDLPLEANNGVD